MKWVLIIMQLGYSSSSGAIAADVSPLITDGGSSLHVQCTSGCGQHGTIVVRTRDKRTFLIRGFLMDRCIRMAEDLSQSPDIESAECLK
jgi:hypothetical protein